LPPEQHALLVGQPVLVGVHRRALPIRLGGEHRRVLLAHQKEPPQELAL